MTTSKSQLNTPKSMGQTLLDPDIKIMMPNCELPGFLFHEAAIHFYVFPPGTTCSVMHTVYCTLLAICRTEQRT